MYAPSVFPARAGGVEMKVFHRFLCAVGVVVVGIGAVAGARLGGRSMTRALLNSTQASGGTVPKVVGGRDADKGEYPSVASLRFPIGYINPQGTNLSGTHLCGGVLISKNAVLTAAHCVHAQELRSPIVQVNRYLRDGVGQYEEFKPIATKIHPLYASSGGWQNYDIAVLVLDRDSQIKPVCLAENELCFEYECVGTVIGWGYTRDGDQNSLAQVLQEAQFPLWSRKRCREVYGRFASGAELISDVMVCGGAKGVDACRADSGGPLLVADCVAGIVSWGEGCGTEKPGVYASVAPLKDWIEEQLADTQVSPALVSTPVPAPLAPSPVSVVVPSPPPIQVLPPPPVPVSVSPPVSVPVSPPVPVPPSPIASVPVSTPVQTSTLPPSPPVATSHSCQYILGRFFPPGCEG